MREQTDGRTDGRTETPKYVYDLYSLNAVIEHGNFSYTVKTGS